MSYLDQLREDGEKKKTKGGVAPTKPTKPGFVSSDGEGVAPVGNFSAEKQGPRPYPISERKMLEAVRAAPLLPAYREALILGRLCICANCERFGFGVEASDMGPCQQHGEVWPFVPFSCPDFVLAARPAAPLYSTRSPLLWEVP